MDDSFESRQRESLADLDLSFLDPVPQAANEIDPSLLRGLDRDLDGNQVAPLESSSLDGLSLHHNDEASEWAHLLAGRDPSTLDYTHFESWIPEFERPAKPCDYCRSKHLECYRYKNQLDCNACTSLFRECSLASTTAEASNYASNDQGTFFDALHTLDEDTCIEQGTRTTIKFLNSKNSNPSSSLQSPDDAAGSNKRNGIRFPRHAVKILRDWLAANNDHPYPSEEEKMRLEEATGLKPSQIANWLANARRRRKIVAKTQPKRALSPSARCPTPAIDITASDRQWDDMNPLQRWQHSPPENEPAAMTDIVNAVVNSDLPDVDAGTPSSMETRRRKASSNGSGLSASARRPGSTTSAETSRDSSHGSSAAYSHGSSHGSYGSLTSSLTGKRERRRRRRQAPARHFTDDKRRIFQCTFCTDTFKSKYDWTRHEKSLHLSLEKWICAPIGPYIIDQESGEKVCVYCGLHNPPDKHDETHSHSACEEKGLESRTFYRKDHLRQHLRLFHSCTMVPSMEAWKFVATNINSRCGFCAQRFVTWQERVDHLTSHFRAGTRMTDWRGCRGFDPPVASIVTNAMPPYLIGIEALSPNPFSATDQTSRDTFETSHPHLCQTQQAFYDSQKDSPGSDQSTKATCWEILTIRLGKYANELNSKGVVITDEMLQSHAREILYGSDDTWNQTAADNPEWLDLFKKAHGLDYIPAAVGGQGDKVPEDLEWYQDLGMRIPFFLQLEQYNRFQKEKLVETGELRPQQQAEMSRQLLKIVQQLSSEGVLHGNNDVCGHHNCGDNAVNVDILDDEKQVRTQRMRWCNETLKPWTTGLLAKFVGLVQSGVPVANPGSALKPSSESSRAAKARAACLEQLQFNEVDCCPFQEQNDVLAQRREAFQAAQAKNHALSALSRSECLTLGDGPAEQANNLSVYLPRHKAVLPLERAKQFATVTGAWEDSGCMPLPYSTASLKDLSLAGQPPGLHLPNTTAAQPVATTGETTLDGFLASADPLSLPTTTQPWSSVVGDIPALTTAELSSIIDAPATNLGLDEMDFDSVFDTTMNADAYSK